MSVQETFNLTDFNFECESYQKLISNDLFLTLPLCPGAPAQEEWEEQTGEAVEASQNHICVWISIAELWWVY